MTSWPRKCHLPWTALHLHKLVALVVTVLNEFNALTLIMVTVNRVLDRSITMRSKFLSAYTQCYMPDVCSDLLMFVLFGVIKHSHKYITIFTKQITFVFHKREKVIQGWNNLSVSKWWQNIHFWVKYLMFCAVHYSSNSLVNQRNII